MRIIVRVLCLAVAILCLLPLSSIAGDNPFPLGKNAVPKTYWGDLQPPAGISFAYLKLTDTVAISDFAVTIGGQKLPPGTVIVDRADLDTNTFQGRFDTWVLPFVNVYGFAATLNGRVHNVPVTVNPLPGSPATAVPAIDIAFTGHIYSVGAVFAGGYKNVFASYDINRAWMTMDIAPDTASSVAQRIRAGVRAERNGIPIKIYAGASLRDATSSGSGKIPGVPGGSFSLTAKSAEPWNTLIGAEIGVSQRLFVTVEAGLGTRKQFLIMPSVRF
jgi:hypothetical protein